jgi:hypothetical protein
LLFEFWRVTLLLCREPRSFQQQHGITTLIYFVVQASTMYLELPGLQLLHLAVAAAAQS